MIIIKMHLNIIVKMLVNLICHITLALLRLRFKTENRLNVQN